MIAVGVVKDFAAGGQFGQRRTEDRRAHATELAQAPQRGGLAQSGQGLTHSFGRGRGGVRWGRSGFEHRQGQGGAGLGELEGDVVAARGGSVFGGPAGPSEGIF